MSTSNYTNRQRLCLPPFSSRTIPTRLTKEQEHEEKKLDSFDQKLPTQARPQHGSRLPQPSPPHTTRCNVKKGSVLNNPPPPNSTFIIMYNTKMMRSTRNIATQEAKLGAGKNNQEKTAAPRPPRAPRRRTLFPAARSACTQRTDLPHPPGKQRATAPESYTQQPGNTGRNDTPQVPTPRSITPAIYHTAATYYSRH